MILFETFGLFVLLTMLGVPLVYGLLIATAGIIWRHDLGHPLTSVFLSYIGGVESFVLIAVPLFMLAGEILSRGGVGRRIITFATKLLGFLPGGMGIATVVSSLIFGGVSGSAIADTAAIGSVMTPAMIRKGYSPAFAGDNGEQRASAAEVWRAFLAAFPALLMPVLILGGIWSGLFTPTEAAAVAAGYGLFVSMVIHRDLKARDLPRLLLKSFTTSAVVMVVIGATSCLAWLITVEQVPTQLAEMVSRYAHSPAGFLILVNLALLALGCFIEPVPALILAAPLLAPLAATFHIDPVHLGLIMTCNLAIGLYTPPVGGTLMVGARLAGVGMMPVVRALIPQLIISVAILLIVTYVPAVGLSLVHLVR